jgi:hypothetical protein
MNNQSIYLLAIHNLEASSATAKKLCFLATFLVFQATKDQQPWYNAIIRVPD